jgi:hypothetical protein
LSHRFYLIAHRLMPKFPILLVELIVQQKNRFRFYQSR